MADFSPPPARPLPERVDVAIVGGGIVGVTAALALAGWGHSVALFEKGRIGCEQSSRNWGWIRAQGRDLREMPLMLEAQAMWPRLAAESGEDFGLTRGGATYLALTEAEMAGHVAWFEAARPFQMATRLLSAREADALAGQDAPRFRGGIHTETDMHAEPGPAIAALARLAARRGVAIYEATAVRVLDMAAGRSCGVVTEHGRVGAEAVMLAGGAWCRPFLENAGLSLPQLAVRSQALRTSPGPRLAPGVIGATPASIRPRRDGGYTVGRTGVAGFDIIPAAFTHFRAFVKLMRDRPGLVRLSLGRAFFGPLGRHRWGADDRSPFEDARILDPSPDPAVLRGIMTGLASAYPPLAGLRMVQGWGGMIDVTPDEIPVIGPVARLPGLILATGLSGHGFGLGPGAGRLAAEIATGRAPLVDPAPFAPARFGL
ncbi:MAG: FAD-binding oxidoreductase [Alphaproteobacteria bacterium]|nr:MAG: FAD-binding oxidoreductase [Alphaproteobacteria bacterium]